MNTDKRNKKIEKADYTLIIINVQPYTYSYYQYYYEGYISN